MAGTTDTEDNEVPCSKNLMVRGPKSPAVYITWERDHKQQQTAHKFYVYTHKISSCKCIIMGDKLKYMMRNITWIPLADA